jgi:hypothetical protein
LGEAKIYLKQPFGGPCCESASNIDPTLIRVQALEVSAKFVNFFGSHRRPIVTPTDLNKKLLNQRLLSV